MPPAADTPSVSDELATVKDEDHSTRLPFPPEFYGNRKLDVVTCNDWVALVRQHILLRNFNVGSAAAVRFASLFLRGPALAWQQVNADSLPKRFDAWSAELLKAFAPVAETELAREKLKALTHFKSLEVYCDMFRRQSLLVSNMSPEDKVDLFISNLKPNLRGSVRLHLLDKAKNDLELAIRAALLIDHERRRDFPTRRYTPSGTATPPAKLSAVQSTSAGAPQERKCYKCGSPDHLRPSCPLLRGRRRPPQRHGQPGRSHAKSVRAEESNS